MKKIVEIFFKLHYGQLLPSAWTDLLLYSFLLFLTSIFSKKEAKHMRKELQSQKKLNTRLGPINNGNSTARYFSRYFVDFCNTILIMFYLYPTMDYIINLAGVKLDPGKDKWLHLSVILCGFCVYFLGIMEHHDRRMKYFQKFDDEFEKKENHKWKYFWAIMAFLIYILLVYIAFKYVI